MIKCPCYKCERRNATTSYNCHSDCEDYKQYRAEIESKKVDNKAEIDTLDYIVCNIKKQKEHRNAKNRN